MDAEISTRDNFDEYEDADGFLKEMSQWSREIAEDLAERNDLGPLTDDHWTVIEYVQKYFVEYGQGPPIVKIGQKTGFSHSHICDMFPCGVARGAYRLAGLPRPFGCL